MLKVQIIWFVLGFKPKTPMEERLAKMCVLPLLLAGILGSPNMETEELAVYLRELILHSSLKFGAWTPTKNSELIDSVRFLWYALPVNHSNILGVTCVGKARTVSARGDRILMRSNFCAHSCSLVARVVLLIT